MVGLAAGEGDSATVSRDGDAVLVHRAGWRLMRGLEPLSPAVFEAWNGLLEGALAVHDRFLTLEVLSRLDWGDPAFTWRIRRAPVTRSANMPRLLGDDGVGTMAFARTIARGLT